MQQQDQPDSAAHVDLKVDQAEEAPKLGGPLAKVAFVIALALAVFQMRTGISGPFGAIMQNAIHLGLAFVLCFILYPSVRGRKTFGNSLTTFVIGGLAGTALLAIALAAAGVSLGFVPAYAWCIIGAVVAAAFYLAGRRVHYRDILPADIVLEVLAVTVAAYTIANYDRILASTSAATTVDFMMAASLLLLVLEAGRRAIGWPMVIMGGLFVLYALFGEYIPGHWGHSPISPSALLYALYMSATGLYGSVVTISATVIGIVVIFGGLLLATGTGASFMDIALSLSGRAKGGPAKAAVIGSSLFGMISGSASANAAIVGNFTIPLMKSVGYSSAFAAGTEATASTGGHIMPPMLAVSAFLMAEFLGVSYMRIVIASLLPAFGYYLALFLVVHLTAVKGNLPGVPPERIPTLRAALWHKSVLWLVLSIGMLLALLGYGFPVMLSVFWASVVVTGLYVVSGNPREIWRRIVSVINGMEQGGRLLVPLAAILGVAQLMVSLLGISGIGVKFAELVTSAGESSIAYALLVSAALALLLGMGLPPVAAYVLCVGVALPGVIALGIPPLVAHMYVFYFTAMGTITPPVCTAVFVTADIASCSWLKASFWAMRLGFAGLIVPLVFAYRPALLFIGSPLEVLLALLILVLGIVAWSYASTGFASRSLRWYERLLFFAGGALLFAPGGITDLTGFMLVVATYLWQRFAAGRLPRHSMQTH